MSDPDIEELERQRKETNRLLRVARKKAKEGAEQEQANVIPINDHVGNGHVENGEAESGESTYDHLEHVKAKSKEKTRSKNDCYPIDESRINWTRREGCIGSLVRFCKTYLPKHFYLKWSKYHYRAAEKIEEAVFEGGLFAFAMPRGSGKTTLCRAGVLWATLCGHSKCVVLIAATDDRAKKHLKYGIGMTLLKTKSLRQDFPHAIEPIIKLGGEARGATGQLYKGGRTFIQWQANHIQFPWIEEPHSIANGAVIETMGMTGEIRGPLYTLPDGSQIRPTLVLADDPQTRESAKSLAQSQSRLETLVGDVAYLAGPDQPIAVVCPCTVIFQDDLADQILDPNTHPEWNPERTKMVEKFPDNMHLWDRYADIRRSHRGAAGMKMATKFYKNNFEEMNAGAILSWPERFSKGELSALQSAMNLKIRNESAFYSEAQNEPVNQQDDMAMPTIDELCAKVTGFEQRVVPADCSEVTVFTDIQDDHLFYMVCAWTPHFTGYVIDYGAWPDQGMQYFTRKDIRRGLRSVYGGDESAFTYAAFTDLAEHIAKNFYTTVDGRQLAIGRWCIDGGWASRVPSLQAWISQSPYKSIIAITKGFGVRATERQFSLSPRAIAQRIGPWEWYWRDGKKAGGWISFNANFWKARVHQALRLEKLNRGSINLYHGSAARHRMLVEHFLAERGTKVTAKGQTIIEFKEIPGRDNEGLDCLAGCALGAQTLGIVGEQERPIKKKRERMSLGDMAKQAS